MSISDLKTIVAIATPPGYGGIGVIRLSGSQSVNLARRLLQKDKFFDFAIQHATLQQIINPKYDTPIDEAIFTYFKAPHSFTGEDVIEISSHGSPIVLNEILRLLVGFGAVLAEPGEFSMRAFLNQRLDLTQAEAIKDLIHAQTAYQARIAARQLRGELSRQLKPIKDGLIELIVHLESAVEFVEDDLDPVNFNLLLNRIDDFDRQLEGLASSYGIGRLIRSGVKLALIGRPNVGKSSLFNRILGKDRAIVTHIPGTTRDTLSETFSINGIPVDLVDTAGIRETEDLIEKLGVERTKSAISEADFVMAVLEMNSSISPEEEGLFGQFPVDIFVINKADLGGELSEETSHYLAARGAVMQVSALTGEGIDELKQFIHQQLICGNQRMDESAIITNERHYQALVETLNALRYAKQDLVSGHTEEVVLTNLHCALHNLGVITGETLIADIINQIFSTFCIGK
ncbi:MAG: tRNA uridine-5-carboxymethylaminomethyl(34) synthesis GTPase MnmE [Blastocatellales bacterium]